MENLHLPSSLVPLPATLPDFGGHIHCSIKGPIKTLVSGACPCGPQESHVKQSKHFRGMEGNRRVPWTKDGWNTAGKRWDLAPQLHPDPTWSHNTLPYTHHVGPRYPLIPKSSLLCLPRPHPSGPTKPTTQTPQRARLPAILSGVVFNEVYAASKFAMEGVLRKSGCPAATVQHLVSGHLDSDGGMEAVAGQTRRGVAEETGGSKEA